MDVEVTDVGLLDEALQYFVQNRGKPPKHIEKVILSKYTATFTNAVENGLPPRIIKTLAESIIFMDNYDINTRRKLIFCLIPRTREFPYEIIPLAVSYATSEGASIVLQNSIIIWIAGLLDYHIIDESNKFVRVCYASLFGLLGVERLSLTVCKLLAKISRREDVTSHRVNLLMKLKKKLGYTAQVSSLIRVYQVFRPDLVVTPMFYALRQPSYSSNFKEHLRNAERRIDEEYEVSQDFHKSSKMWPDNYRTKNMNPFSTKNAVATPEILVYSDKIEEKKMKKISVLEYVKLKDMISDVHKWRKWRWPNNASSLLWKPAIIPLFKPHDFQIKVSITNWLELALRTEIIEQVGPRNIGRQLSLLESCIQLSKYTDSLIPAIFHFLVEYLHKWDQHSFISKILELISVAVIPFSLPAVFLESIFEPFCNILSTAPIALWCAIIYAFSALCVTWALEASNLTKDIMKSKWPLYVEGYTPLEGIFFLTQRLERVFMATVIRLGPHPLILNTIYSYYLKINKTCEYLSLPLLVVPPPEFLLLALSYGDITAINRIGIMFGKLKSNIDKLKTMEPIGNDRYLKSVSLYQVSFVNTSLTFFLDSIYTSKGFGEKWFEILSPYFMPNYWKKLLNLDNIRHFGSCGRALIYSPLFAAYYIDKRVDVNEIDQRRDLINATLEKLNEKNLKGISICISKFVRK